MTTGSGTRPDPGAPGRVVPTGGVFRPELQGLRALAVSLVVA